MNNIGFKSWDELNSANKSILSHRLFILAGFQIGNYKQGRDGWERNWIKFKDPKHLTINGSNKTIYGFDRIGFIINYGKYKEYPSPEIERIKFDQIDKSDLIILYENAYNSVFPLPMESFIIGNNYYTYNESLLSFNVPTFKSSTVIEGDENDLEKLLTKAVYQNYLMKQVCVFIELRDEKKSKCIYSHSYKI
jgi:hypothetical protein